MSDLRWTRPRARAAQLVADDRLTDEQIAAEVGVSIQALYKWKRHPAFQARVAEIVAAYAAALKRKGLADKEFRLAALNDRHQRLQQIVEARAHALDEAQTSGGADPFLLLNWQGAALASGFATGLVTLEWATTPKGGFRPQFKTDTALSGEMRALEKQAAQELGDWAEKHQMEHTGADGAPLVVRWMTSSEAEAQIAAVAEQKEAETAQRKGRRGRATTPSDTSSPDAPDAPDETLGAAPGGAGC